jgi:hypothetical protein
MNNLSKVLSKIEAIKQYELIGGELIITCELIDKTKIIGALESVSSIRLVEAMYCSSTNEYKLFYEEN